MAASLHLLIFAVVLLLLRWSDAASPSGGRPAYERFTFDAAQFPADDQYDYIVVGGGTAGCPLAATLSSAHRVLLLERGGAPNEFPYLATQDGFLRTLVDTSDHDSPAQAFVSEDGVPNARGRVLGGSSAINAGFYSRAHPEFFGADGEGAVAWNMALVNESYEWVERAVAFRPELRNWQSAVRDALLEANVTPWNGYTVEHVAGTKVGATTFDSAGRRHSAADLLNYARPDNLRVALRATVDRVLFNPLHPGSPSSDYYAGHRQVAASGVVYRDRQGLSHRAMTRAGGEVVVCAGALGSPQLLLLSGVGPRPYLASWGIPVAVHSPNVGRLMTDNPRTGVSIAPPPSVPLDHSLIQVVGIPDARAGPFIEAASTVVAFRTPVLLRPFVPAAVPPLYLNVATVIAKLARPRSSGSLRLASLDARDAPLVRFNYFASPEDLADCVDGARRVGEVMEGRAMDEFRSRAGIGWWGGPFRFVGAALPENRSDEAGMEEFCRRTVATIWHYHGGCVAGRVVDGEFRVVDAAGLRVVDGSTLSVSPGTNPQATLMMMGRYMGLKMMEERRRNMVRQRRSRS